MMHQGLHRLDDLEPSFRTKIDALLAALAAAGIYVGVASTRRTIQQQNQLYAQGRNGNKGQIVTNAKGGQSPHNFGLAVDFCALTEKGDWNWSDEKTLAKVGEIAEEEFSLIWGGHFKSIPGGDKPHVESPSWRETQAAWRRGEINVA